MQEFLKENINDYLSVRGITLTEEQKALVLKSVENYISTNLTDIIAEAVIQIE